MVVPKPPPFANYGVLSGQLFLYSSGRAAFESPIVTTRTQQEQLPPRKCILVGGLSDGLLPVPYTNELETACHASGGDWSLVQPVLSSSYTGFGHGSLRRDCHELEELMQYLVDYRNATEFCLVGHSTGCQDAVYFLKHAAQPLRQRLKVVALQAPVSDREGAMMEDGYQNNLEIAQRLVADGKGEEMMPRAAFWAPMTAQRYVDLHEKGGMDDFFSSDYTDETLVDRLAHVGRQQETNDELQVLVACSGADEYVPSHIDKSVLTDRLVAAMNHQIKDKERPVAQRLYLETGNHNLSQGAGDGSAFVAAVAKLLQARSNNQA